MEGKTFIYNKAEVDFERLPKEMRVGEMMSGKYMSGIRSYMNRIRPTVVSATISNTTDSVSFNIKEKGHAIDWSNHYFECSCALTGLTDTKTYTVRGDSSIIVPRLEIIYGDEDASTTVSITHRNHIDQFLKYFIVPGAYRSGMSPLFEKYPHTMAADATTATGEQQFTLAGATTQTLTFYFQIDIEILQRDGMIFDISKYPKFFINLYFNDPKYYLVSDLAVPTDIGYTYSSFYLNLPFVMATGSAKTLFDAQNTIYSYGIRDWSYITSGTLGTSGDQQIDLTCRASSVEAIILLCYSATTSTAFDDTTKFRNSNITETYVVLNDVHYPRIPIDATNARQLTLNNIQALTSISGSKRLMPYISSSLIPSADSGALLPQASGIVYNMERIDTNDDVVSGTDLDQDCYIVIKSSGDVVANRYDIYIICDKIIRIAPEDGQQRITVSEKFTSAIKNDIAMTDE